MLKAKAQSKNYVSAFVNAAAEFARMADDALGTVSDLLVEEFDADRAELWLWDGASGSCYLTNFSGIEAKHRLDYAPGDAGVVGKNRSQCGGAFEFAVGPIACPGTGPL